MFTILIIILLTVTIKSQARELNSCGQPFTLNKPEHQKIEVDLKPVNATVITSQPRINTIMFKTTKYSLLCQDAFNNLFNKAARCEKSTKTMSYTLDQLQEMERRRECLIGRECTLDSCYSKETIHCTDDILNRYGRPRNSGVRMTGTKLVYQSCYVNWDCSIQDVSAPVYANSENGKFYIHFDSSEKIYLDNTKAVSKNGWNFILPKLETSETKEKINCLESPDHVVCDVPGSRRTSILMTKTGYGSSANVLIKSVVPSKTSSLVVDGNPTVEQLKAVISDLVEEDLKDKYNFMILRNAINEIVNRLYDVTTTGRLELLTGIRDSQNQTLFRLGDNEFSICSKEYENSTASIQSDTFRKVDFIQETPLYVEELSTTLVRDDYETRRFQEIERRLSRDEGITEHTDQTNQILSNTSIMGFGLEHIIESVKLYGGISGILSLLLLMLRR